MDSAEPSAAETAASANAEPAAQKSLLDDEPEPAADAADAEGKQPEAAAEPPSEEDIDAFCKAIPATDLGDGVGWSDDTLRAMAPSLMELTGRDPKKADAVVRAFQAHVQDVRRRQNEASEAFNRGQIDQCRKRFGADLPSVARDARVGLMEIFGPELGNALKSTPEFANNPDVIERLAAFGRRIRQDSGAVLPQGGTPVQDSSDVLHRMYGNVKVG